MPPKKTDKKKPQSTPVVSATPSNEPSKQELEEQISRLRVEVDREREERNYFQLERDKINTFWEITKRELEEKKAELRNKEREIEEAEEKHQTEIRVYKQKVKHLLYEQQNTTTELKVEGVVATKVLEKEQAEVESQLQTEIQDLKKEMKEQEISYQNLIKDLKLSNYKEIRKLRIEFEENINDFRVKYENLMQQQREEQDVRRKTEIHEVEQSNKSHVNTITANHEKAFSDIKNYYNDLILGSTKQISSLKEQVDDLKKKNDSLEKDLAQLQRKNKNLIEALQKATQEVSELQKQLTCSKNLKDQLVETKARLKVSEKKVQSLKWENEVLIQTLDKVQKEHDELEQTFDVAILEVQQKYSLKNLLLEKKLKALTETMRDALLHRVAASYNREPSAQNVVDPDPESQICLEPDQHLLAGQDSPVPCERNEPPASLPEIVSATTSLHDSMPCQSPTPTSPPLEIDGSAALLHSPATSRGPTPTSPPLPTTAHEEE